jgi:hypothetical protein
VKAHTQRRVRVHVLACNARGASSSPLPPIESGIFILAINAEAQRTRCIATCVQKMPMNAAFPMDPTPRRIA